MDPSQHKLRWMRLDNAALIFPASLRRHWSNLFRISFTFSDPVDPARLQQALDAVAPRFPSVCVRVRGGAFWYYLEELPRPPLVAPDGWQPLRPMTRGDIRKCAVRVLYYRNRMAVEFFHSVTDGTGGMIFAKSLAAEYLRRHCGVFIPCTCGVRDPAQPPPAAELVDSFRAHAGPVAAPRDDRNVYRLRGDPEPDRFLHVTLGILDSEALRSRAKALGVTLTAYLTALLLHSLLEIQAQDVPRRKRRKPVKVQIPVNLRRLYGGETMRNFVAVANVGVDPRMGDYTLAELAQIVHHQMQLAITAKNMSAIFTPNVNSERNPLIKIIPLCVKNLILRIVFDRVGESVATVCLSNLGEVTLPEEMAPYVRRVELVLGSQASAPYNVSVTSWQGRTFVNVVRNTRRARLEEQLFTQLVRLGCRVSVESNEK